MYWSTCSQRIRKKEVDVWDGANKKAISLDLQGWVVVSAHQESNYQSCGISVVKWEIQENHQLWNCIWASQKFKCAVISLCFKTLIYCCLFVHKHYCSSSERFWMQDNWELSGKQGMGGWPTEMLVRVICNKAQKSWGRGSSSRLSFRVMLHKLFCAYINPMVCLLTLFLKLQAKGSLICFEWQG